LPRSAIGLELLFTVLLEWSCRYQRHNHSKQNLRILTLADLTMTGTPQARRR